MMAVKTLSDILQTPSHFLHLKTLLLCNIEKGKYCQLVNGIFQGHLSLESTPRGSGHYQLFKINSGLQY